MSLEYTKTGNPSRNRSFKDKLTSKVGRGLPEPKNMSLLPSITEMR